MDDLISRQAAIDAANDWLLDCLKVKKQDRSCGLIRRLEDLPSAQPEIVRCCKCSYWDRDSLRHQCNDFRDWNEAECKILAERDPYDEINRYTEADDYCSRAERKHDE